MITNIEQSTINYMKWYAINYLNAEPTTFFTEGIYPYEVQNISINPKLNNFFVNTFPKEEYFQVIENNTDTNQLQNIKFSEKSIETITNTTTLGYTLYKGIKLSTTFNILVNFMISGSIEQSLEIPFNSEFKCYSTETTKKTFNKLWEFTQPVIVPPHTRITATLIIMGATIKIPTQLSANINGAHMYNNKENWFSSISFRQFNGSKVKTLFAASNLSQNSWPKKPSIFASPGPHGSLNLRGESIITVEPGLYTVAKFVESPLDGFSNERKTWYTDKVILRDGRMIQLPNLNPLTGKSSFIDTEIILIEDK
ncbi:TPA: ETX/MTX2 family pore-forming toxin [Bacillus thuringiensis]|nr:ETX/MTX2 family pore-forming toxin [Bacillus thuringiensis]